MKSAKELFKELGYEEIRKNEYFLDYENYKEQNYIGFCLKEKTFYKMEDNNIGDITMQELKAINKMVEEMGWNE